MEEIESLRDTTLLDTYNGVIPMPVKLREMHGALHKLLDELTGMKPKPIHMEMVPTGVQVLKSYKFPDTNEAVIALEVRFRLTNLSTTQTTRGWGSAVCVRNHASMFPSRDQYPVKGFDSYIRFNNDIAPTCTMGTEAHFGFRVALDKPLIPQLETATAQLELSYHPISENHVGDDVATPFVHVIALPDLIREAKRSLHEASIDFVA